MLLFRTSTPWPPSLPNASNRLKKKRNFKNSTLIVSYQKRLMAILFETFSAHFAERSECSALCASTSIQLKKPSRHFKCERGQRALNSKVENHQNKSANTPHSAEHQRILMESANLFPALLLIEGKHLLNGHEIIVPVSVPRAKFAMRTMFTTRAR